MLTSDVFRVGIIVNVFWVMVALFLNNRWYKYSLKLNDEWAEICEQPQITHCAECIHWKHSDVRKNYCEVFDWINTADDFCSFAERRTDEQSS